MAWHHYINLYQFISSSCDGDSGDNGDTLWCPWGAMNRRTDTTHGCPAIGRREHMRSFGIFGDDQKIETCLKLFECSPDFDSAERRRLNFNEFQVSTVGRCCNSHKKLPQWQSSMSGHALSAFVSHRCHADPRRVATCCDMLSPFPGRTSCTGSVWKTCALRSTPALQFLGFCGSRKCIRFRAETRRDCTIGSFEATAAFPVDVDIWSSRFLFWRVRDTYS